MAKLGDVKVGKTIRCALWESLMLVLNHFYKKSINTTKTQIKNAVKQIEDNGADFIDVGGMSTAPYLNTTISEKLESKRICDAIKIIQNNTNLPISVDTCRASVAKTALENDVEILNDISGLKYDKKNEVK